jgi:hypothetical protein
MNKIHDSYEKRFPSPPEDGFFRFKSHYSADYPGRESDLKDFNEKFKKHSRNISGKV